MARGDLTAMQTRFVNEYLVDLNGTAAARRAGVNGTEASLAAVASKWLRMGKVQKLVAMLEKPRLEKAQLSAQDVLEAITHQVKADIRELYDEHGDVKSIHNLTKAQAAMIIGVEHVMKNATSGDGKIDRVLKVKFAPRDRYVEMAPKHFKLLTEVMQVMDVERLNERLERGRQRYAKMVGEYRGGADWSKRALT